MSIVTLIKCDGCGTEFRWPDNLATGQINPRKRKVHAHQLRYYLRMKRGWRQNYSKDLCRSCHEKGRRV